MVRLQVCDGDMLLLPFQSGCEARIQMVRPNRNLLYLVAIQTRPFQRAVLLSVVHPSASYGRGMRCGNKSIQQQGAKYENCANCGKKHHRPI